MEDLPVFETPSVFLKKPEDWTRWYSQIKKVAELHNVWKYIDPYYNIIPRKPKMLNFLDGMKIEEATQLAVATIARETAAPRPTTAAAAPAATSSTQRAASSPTAVTLGGPQIEEEAAPDPNQSAMSKIFLEAAKTSDMELAVGCYETFISRTYHRACEEYQRKAERLVCASLFITASLSPEYNNYILGAVTARAKLQELITNIYPGKWEERNYAEKALEKLLATDLERCNLTAWVISIMKAFDLCKDLGSRLGEEDDMIRRFLETVGRRFPSWANMWHITYTMAIDREENIPRFAQIAFSFRTGIAANAAAETSLPCNNRRGRGRRNNS